MSETSTNDSNRVWYDEMSDAFVGETIERDGIMADVEAVIGNSDSPTDDDARFSLEVRARAPSPDTEQEDDDADR